MIGPICRSREAKGSACHRFCRIGSATWFIVEAAPGIMAKPSGEFLKDWETMIATLRGAIRRRGLAGALT